MDPKELAETTLNPRHRTFLQVQIDSSLKTDKTFVDLLGKDPSQRYRFIMHKAARALAEELDVYRGESQLYIAGIVVILRAGECAPLSPSGGKLCGCNG